MGEIYEEIEIEGIKKKVKIDTGSDFALCLRKEVIEELKLIKHPTAKAIIYREEKGKLIPDYSPVYLANIKIKNCPAYVEKIVEAFGQNNLLGHPILQLFKAKIDEEKEELIIGKCPTFTTGGKTGEIIYETRTLD